MIEIFVTLLNILVLLAIRAFIVYYFKIKKK